jgi:DNA-binding transcriptional MerR regulator
MAPDKSPDAFLTIGELSGLLDVPQHVLRYWETRFPQLKPVKRAGNRRYYRREDVALATRIKRLLEEEGYTAKGVQQLLARERPIAAPSAEPQAGGTARLSAIRDSLAAALAAD